MGVDDLYREGLYDSKENLNIMGAFARKAYCMTTGMPIPKVFQSLKDTGFSFDELRNLEYLSDEKIAGRCNIKVSKWVDGQDVASGQFSVKESLIKYLKAWVSILEEEQEPIKQPQHIDQTSSFTNIIPIPDEVADTVVKEVVNN
jgi:hypothetical protein